MSEPMGPTGAEIPRESDLVVVTGDHPEELVKCLLSVVQSAVRPTTIRVATFGEDAEAIAQVVQTLAMPSGVELVVDVGGYAGKDGQRYTREFAVDLALSGIEQLPPVVFILEQDARVMLGWTDSLVAALETRTVLGAGHQWGQLGIAVPVTDQTKVASQRLELQEHEAAMGPQAYADARRLTLTDKYTAAGSIDTFCMAVRQQVLEIEGTMLLDPACGDHAGDDLAVRARVAGWSCVVAEDCYVGRTTGVPLGHRDKPPSAEGRMAFYRRHAVRPKRLGIAYRVALRTLNDLHLFRQTIAKAGMLADCIGVVLLNNPADITQSGSFKALLKTAAVSKADVRMLKACSGGAPVGEVAKHFGAWVADMGITQGGGAFSAKVRVWDLPRDEALERDAAAAICRELAADWILTLEPDEMLEERVTRGHLDRLMSHPNPLVRAWDMGIIYHWDSPRLMRDDEGWGHNGTYQGGPHSIRMWRADSGVGPPRITALDEGRPAAAPFFSPECIRVSGIRIRKFGLQRPIDRTRLTHPPVEEGMRLSSYDANNGIGLHILEYEKEHPEDLARWLDAVHGLIDGVVLVWTGEWATDDLWLNDHGLADTRHRERLRDNNPVFVGEDRWWYDTGPVRDMAAVAAWHGAAWKHQPLDQNLAAARNAGIDALHNLGGLAWAMFIDPDEWLQDPYADCIALRNMAMSSRWGWMFQVANYREGKEPTISDSVRISRLDDKGEMRMDGRVHEGFGRALRALDKRGVHPRWRYAPFVLQHRGMSLESERMRSKLDQYEALLRLELADHPHNAGAWISLGWHYFNDGHEELGLECYRRGVACADAEGGRSYLPFKELAYYHLREARQLIDGCCERMEDSHQFYTLAHTLRKFLVAHAPPIPLIERPADREPEVLPVWSAPAQEQPAGYDAL